MQFSSSHGVATPVDWNVGDDVIISPAIDDDRAKALFPGGVRTLTPYLHYTPQPAG